MIKNAYKSNTKQETGNCWHYCLSPLRRWDVEEILALIGQEKYFLLHAPRQTGKTTCLLALADQLNQDGHYRAVYANLEPAQAARENVAMGMAAAVEQIARGARDQINDDRSTELAAAILATSSPTTPLEEFLTRWCAQSAQPTVLLLDEVDALIGDTLIALLRQLRAGYPKRPARFPQTVILCGVRDLRDYRIHASAEQSVLTGGSAFNIKAESLRLGDFSEADVRALLQQHTDETGQTFTPEALAAVWTLTPGQPWLVNALAYETCFRMPEGRDRSRPITGESIDQARENLILRRVTHLDQLADKLREDRVRRVIEAMLAGMALGEVPEDDPQYSGGFGVIAPGGQRRLGGRQSYLPGSLAAALAGGPQFQKLPPASTVDRSHLAV